MKKYEIICEQVAADVKDIMQTVIEADETNVSYEKEVGDAMVIVEVYQRRVNGWMMTFTDVVIAHEDCRHRSPLLRKAIEKSLPDFDKMQAAYENRHTLIYQ